MLYSIYLASAYLVTIGSALQQTEHEALMDQIEQAAKLPQGAFKLNDYIRIYAGDADGQVVASYVLPSIIEKLANEECEQLEAAPAGGDEIDLIGQEVPCVAPEIVKVKAGQRLWITSRDLPFDVVAGCEVITLAYDARKQQFDELGCVGHRLPAGY